MVCAIALILIPRGLTEIGSTFRLVLPMLEHSHDVILRQQETNYE